MLLKKTRYPKVTSGGRDIGSMYREICRIIRPREETVKLKDFMGKVSITMEKLYIINLDVLSSVLYRWGRLEETVRIRLNTRDRRHKFKS